MIEHAEVIHKGDDSGNEMTVRWNQISLESRANELLQHHIERCGAIIAILNTGPKTAEEIAAEHFEERLLEGFGNLWPPTRLSATVNCSSKVMMSSR